MRKRDYIMSKMGRQLQKELNDIKIKRRMDIDKKFTREISTERLTNGIVKFPEWLSIKKKLLEEPREEDLI